MGSSEEGVPGAACEVLSIRELDATLLQCDITKGDCLEIRVKLSELLPFYNAI